MISLTCKLLRFLYGRYHPQKQFDEKEKECSSRSPVISQQLECTVSGTVTKINAFESYGLIDDSIYFSFDVVCGQDDIKIGDNVTVSAYKQHIEHGWRAKMVQLLHEDWTSENVEFSSTMPQRPISSREDTESKTIEGKVTESYSTFGILDNKYRFEMKHCKISFKPMMGDVISAYVKNEIVIDWEPKIQKKVEGLITVREMDFGVVDDSIIFFFANCCCNVAVLCGQKVLASVVESCQQAFKLRAYELWPTGSPEKKLSKPRLNNHSGLFVTENLNFETVIFEHEKALPLTVKNTSENHLKFLSCKLQTTSEFPLFHCSSKIVFLPPHTEVTLTVTCKPWTLGYHQDMLMLEFDDFVILRSVSVFVSDLHQQMLEATAPYTHPKPNIKMKNSDTEKLLVVPGEKVFIPKANFAGYKPNYHIPHSLWKLIEDNANLTRALPVLNQEVNRCNYMKKFSYLLHLEEIATVLYIRQFDMREAVMYRKGDFLSLAIPGLAEGRPSLLIGDRAMLTAPHNNSNMAYEGHVHEVHKDDIFLKFSENFQQSYNGEIYDVFFKVSRTNIKRMHEGLKIVSRASIIMLFPPEILHCRKSSRRDFNGFLFKWQNKMLNTQQKAAIQKVVEGKCRPYPYIIFGPPGTGKTVTIVEAIVQIFLNMKKARILICTPSNSAADLVTQKLIESNVLDSTKLVRLNSYQRNVDSIPDVIKPFCRDKNDTQEALNSPIVVCTCSTAGFLQDLEFPSNHFTHLFIDEAGQLTEPETMVPISLIVRNKEASLILAGDPKQLGSVLLSNTAQAHGLQISYMERIMNCPLYREKKGYFDSNYVTLLTQCYRCHPAILCYPSRAFYFSSVNSSQEGVWGSLENCEFLPKKGFPIVFVGVVGEENREENSPSWFNSAEVVEVCKYLKSLYEMELTSDDIGIISPYRKQVEKIRFLATALNLELCKIGSVEEFQGQEKRAIVISMVRSSKDFVKMDLIHNIGFLRNPKRFNVAVTRAKELLIIIGNPYVLSQDSVWSGFIKYCLVNGGYTGCNISPSDLEYEGP